MADIIKFLKVRDVKSPSRANAYDAGIDFYVPQLTKEFIDLLGEKNPQLKLKRRISFSEFGEGKIELWPSDRILIPSGIHCQMSNPGRALIAANKSGVASKHGLIFGAQVVDYEYQGEIHLNLINTGDGIITLTSGMKILQFLEMPVFNSIIEIEEGKEPKEFYEEETTRGHSGFGSTDKK